MVTTSADKIGLITRDEMRRRRELLTAITIDPAALAAPDPAEVIRQYTNGDDSAFEAVVELGVVTALQRLRPND